MINMRVREDNCIHFAWIVRKVQISNVRLAASTLIQPTVQQEAMPIDLQQMLTPSHCMGSAMKIDPHLRLLKDLEFVLHTDESATANPT